MTGRATSVPVVWEIAPGPVRAQLSTVVALEAAGVTAAVLPGASVSSPDPILVAGAARIRTRRIGLVPSFSPWVQPPFHTARALGTLDALTGGRAGWFVRGGPPGFVSTDDTPRWNPSHVTDPTEVDEALGDYLDAVLALWNSWEPDALIADVTAGQYVDPSKVHVIDYHGDYVEVRGPLNMPRSPQGRPVLFASGSSRDGDDAGAGAGIRAGAGAARADVLVVDTEAEAQAASTGDAAVLLRLHRPDAAPPAPTAADGYLISGVSAVDDGALFGALLYTVLPQLTGAAEASLPVGDAPGRSGAPLLRDRLGLPAPAFDWASPTRTLTKGTR